MIAMAFGFGLQNLLNLKLSYPHISAPNGLKLIGKHVEILKVYEMTERILKFLYFFCLIFSVVHIDEGLKLVCFSHKTPYFLKTKQDTIKCLFYFIYHKCHTFS